MLTYGTNITGNVIQYSLIGIILLICCVWILWKLSKKSKKGSNGCSGCSLYDNCIKKDKNQKEF